MAHIRKEITIDIPPKQAWDALRDFGALHERLVPGFAVDLKLEGDDRVVTFFNGAQARERLIDLDDERRRLSWTIVEGSYAHHNGVAEVVPDGEGTRFVWTADILPHELADPTSAMMERGTQVVKQTLEAAAVRP